jgi:rubrerythrin
MYQFYRLSMRRTRDPQLRAVLEELYHKEEDHLNELEQKYHIHLNPDLRQLPESVGRFVSEWIFDGIDFDDQTGHALPVYEKAIAMERRTRDHYKACSECAPPGPEKEIYRELAAEEEEHVSILETELDQFIKK